ncbi:MAG: TonB-dependent receptor, partial [Novosphingobium sp.]|nr:TonB-dependent receptor [Novosphingobium sp.]
MRYPKTTLAILLTGTALCLVAHPAAAATTPTYAFNLPAQGLGDALRAVAARAGWEVYADAAAIEGLRARPLHGTRTARAAIVELLAGTGLTATFGDRSVVVRARDSAANEAAASDADSPPDSQIVVTGTHIRGAEVASQVITVSRETIRDRGQADLGEATRAIPQNFGGGQNPGVGFGAGLINSNVNSASSVNLRGLGPDATLTLLEGHRLPYDSAFSGVDISAIPVAAIDRLEIVADGASALYGSDAVGGVVNVVLRHDARGLSTSARLGASTDGGNFQQQADVVYGAGWSGGDLLVAYDYAHNSAILAEQRDYRGVLPPKATLYPRQRRHAVTLAGRQDLTSGVTFNFDAIYSHRTSETLGGLATSPFLFQPRVETFSAASRLDVELGAGWKLKAQGAYGLDRTQLFTTFSPSGSPPAVTRGCLCNTAWSAEIGADGPLFALGGGSARLALGAGTRSNALDNTRFVNNAPTNAFDESQDSRFAYAELFLPFVGPGQNLPGLNRLNLSAALRYEDYPDLAQLATPRIALIYAPVQDLTLKGTWSRSFKAPTLFQRFIGYQAFLLPGAALGVGPTGSTVLFTSGGNPALEPERARSWSAGFEFRPAAVPELTLTANWFDIRYKDRVVQPIAGSVSSAFRDPGLATLINFMPASADLAALIAGAQLGLQNFAGSAFDPARVFALVDNRNR